jgi:hypothetical protein
VTGDTRRAFDSVPAVSDPLAPLLALPGVEDAVSRARTAVDTLLANRTLRTRSGDVSAESSMRGAWASAWLAGSHLALADVRAGTPHALADPVLQGALRATAAVGTVAETWRHAPRQALARLHALAAADLVSSSDELGRPQPAAAERLDTLAAVLAVTAAPAVVVAGVVHGELLSLDAFAPSSGIVARAAARVCLVDRGLDPKSLVVLEAGHRELGADYDEALHAYGTGSAAGIGHWLVHCADAVAAGAVEALAISTALGRG